MLRPSPLLPDSLRRPLVGAFFALVAVLGILLHRDYGLSWDEQLDRLNGIISVKYVALRLAPELARRQENFAAIPDMRQNEDVDHGVIFQMPLVVLEKLVGADDPREVYFLRHLVTFFTVAAGIYAFYRLARRRFRSWLLGLLGAGLLLLSPRLFAEAFYNYKDLVFLAFFTGAIYSLTRLLRRPSWRWALTHALLSGAALDVRTMGVLLVGFTVFFAGLELLYRPAIRKPLLLALALYLPVTAAVVVAGWPYLWENPLGHFLAAFQSFSRYRSDMLVQYWGQQISVRHLPWHYAPVWLLITTPVAYTLLFLVGLGTLGYTLVQQPGRWLRTRTGRQDLLFAVWFFAPLTAIILLHSVVYDGWRHLYFIYPAFVLLALRGVAAGVAWQARPGSKRWLGAALLLAVAGDLLHSGYRIARDHPYQNVYFSFLPGPVAERLFERDYWGLSGRQGLEWILAHDSSAHVTVGTDARSALVLHNNHLLLPPAERRRLVLTSAAQARYFLTTYRWHPGSYPASYGPEVYSIRVGGVKILSVFRRP
ncbi:glycosyltransferase family 39 protein [Hymenobacter sp. BT635]|uniref:Glycosyltransferase family 39 protein n=1 Tax=Hymenobacter nitidus TaxID=2880929 RepID=A0ABS8AL24_9BACT|nr:glycosyltransferase family 39 protein [Hymenobacter nitidus]MCB2380209.1 glycosyltransferase family 39 protein [Hymenobacter nitidus]